jgi:capsid protein
MSLLTGALSVDTRLASNYYDVAWKGRGWQWVDPLKDLQALKLGIDLGVDSRQHANGEQGREYEDVVDDLQYEEEYAEEANVDVSGNQIAGISPTRVSPEGESDDAEETNKDGESSSPSSPNNNKSRGKRVGLSGGRTAAAQRRLFHVAAGGEQ